MAKQKAPAAVRKAAAYYLERFPDARLSLAGREAGAEFWYLRFAVPVVIGYPVVVRFVNGVAALLDGEEALRMLAVLGVED